MDIKHLRLIKAVEEEGGITKASEVLFLSQSALSYQLKEAELQLGTKIFYRQNKKLILTPVGKIWYDAANQILRQIEKTESETKQMLNGESAPASTIKK